MYNNKSKYDIYLQKKAIKFFLSFRSIVIYVDGTWKLTVYSTRKKKKKSRERIFTYVQIYISLFLGGRVHGDEN